MRILITGGSSYLGQHLVPQATAVIPQVHFTTHQHALQPTPNGATGHPLDIRDATAVDTLVQALRPDVIIHTAGSNRVPDMTSVIEDGTRRVAAAARRVGARLVHISTDVVFDGRSAPYREEDPPQPLHAYGRAKANAEATLRSQPNCVIVRTSLIYGLRRIDRGTAWIAAALSAGEPVTLFTDQLRNPVWVHSLCEACLELAQSSYAGILHVAGSQVLSRAEFGLRLLDWWGISRRETVVLGTSDPERWPRDCTLDLSRAAKILATPLPGVDAVLAGTAKNEQISD